MILLQLIAVMGMLFASGCVINGVASKEDIAKDRIGRPISAELDFIQKIPRAGAKVIVEKSYKTLSDHQVIVIDTCYIGCIPHSSNYSCIIYHEVDKRGIVIKAWADPSSWKVRPKEERGTIHDTPDPQVCNSRVLLGKLGREYLRESSKSGSNQAK